MQDVFGAFPKPKFKWADVKGVTSQAQAMADEVKRLSELSKFNPTEPDKAVPIVIGGIVTVAAIPVRIQMMTAEAQGLAKKMSDYAGELSTYVSGPDLPSKIQKLADDVRGLDDQLIKDVEDALNPLDAKAVSELAGRFRRLERDAAGWVSLGIGEAASIQSFAGRAAGLLEKASKIQIVGTPLRNALAPVSSKLDQAALYLGQLAQPNGLLKGFAEMLTMFAAGVNELAGWSASQNGCTQPDATNGCLGELFSKPEVQGANGIPIGQIVSALGAIGKMQAGGTAAAPWNQAFEEVGAQGATATVGRFIRKTVPLRQEEIDKAGGDDNAAAEALEERAKQEYEKIRGYGQGQLGPGVPTREELRKPGSPYVEASRKACLEVQKKWGADRVKCD